MADTATPKPAAPRWMRILLVVSLAFNLLILGLVLGAVLRGGPHDRRIARDMGGAPFVMALAPADRAALIGEFHAEPGSLREDRRLLRERFHALLAALRAERFDRKAVQDLLAAQRGAAADRQAVGERLLLDRLEAMAPEARAAYADRLEHSLRRGPRP